MPPQKCRCRTDSPVGLDYDAGIAAYLEGFYNNGGEGNRDELRLSVSNLTALVVITD